MTAVVIPVYLLVSAYYLLVLTRGRWLLNAGPLFVLQQLAFFLGILLLIDWDIPADRIHLAVALGALCFFVAGNLYGRLLAPVSPAAARAFFNAPICRVETGTSFNTLIAVIIVTSVVVSMAYYQAVGYNLFLDSLKSVVSGSGPLTDISTLRLRAYAGAEYFAAGYVNQFKNILLPISVAYLTVRYILLRRKGDLILVSSLTVPSLLFLLGTGQRGPAFVTFCIIGAFFNAALPDRVRKKLTFALGLLLVLVLLSGTLFLGRTVSQITTTSDIRGLAGEVVDRFVAGNQSSAVIGFRYVYDLPPQWLHGEWVMGLAGIIPGHERRTGLASEIFRVFYRSTRGTAPASIWGVAWYDFRLPGVLVLAFVLGLSYQLLYARLIRGPKTLARLLVYANVIVVLGLWSIGGPDTPINVGLLTVLIFMALAKVSVRLVRFGKKLSYTDACVVRGDTTRRGYHAVAANRAAIGVPSAYVRRPNA